MWLFLILGLVIFLIVLIHVFFPKRYNWPSTLKTINKIPGPKGLPFFGNALTFLVSNEEFLPTLIHFTNQYEPIWKVTILGKFFVILTDLDCIETILNGRCHMDKGENYQFLLPWLGTGLLLSSGKKWSDHRKWLTPTFHFNILEKQFLHLMNKHASTLVKTLLRVEGSDVEINNLISHCTLDIICETAMGTQVNAQLGGGKEYVKAVIRMSQIFTERLLKPWLYRDFLFHLSRLGREHYRTLKIVHSFTRKVIKERQLAFRKKLHSKKYNESENPMNDIGEKKKLSFLDLLIEISETKNCLTEEDIREEVDTFMFEGHDTTANAICWALYELGLHPEIQEKTYQEQCAIFQETDRELVFTDLNEMKYLERVIKETLRLYPSVPIISRIIEKNVKMGNVDIFHNPAELFHDNFSENYFVQPQIAGNYEIPKGTEVPVFVYYVHRDPKIYPEPEKFNPDRFLPELIRFRHPFSYLPFSAGPRNCIGQRFAMMEQKIILSNIIRNFKITTVTKPEDIQIMGEIILRPKENLKIIFKKR